MNTAPRYTTAAEFQTAFKALAKLERRRADKAAQLAAKLAGLKAKHEEEAAPDLAEIAAIRAALADYAEANRAELTGSSKSKTVTVLGGSVKWRKQPAKVEITGEPETIIAALKRRRLTRFIRTKEEIDRAAILREPEAIKTPIAGLAIVGGGEVMTIETGA